MMANIESFPILCSSTDGINANDVGDLSLNGIPRNLNNGEASVLASISTDNEACDNISSRGVASLTSNIDDVINNDGDVRYLTQTLSQTNNNLINSLTNASFDFPSVNAKDSLQSLIGSANLLSVPATTAVNNQLYGIENVKAEGNVNKLTDTVQVNSVMGLGQNSIRLVQPGNQPNNFQNLTPEQLNQILRLLQRQQTSIVNQEAMLIDPNTQQKTVFKICYANQQVGNIPPSNYGVGTSHVNEIPVRVNHNMQGRQPQIDADVLMRIDKEHKKKHRPRTRSGRVSKPPQYMVKDYKHIHPVDYDEDYDDSDGGYSDFKLSSGEEDNKMAEDNNSLSYASLKSKRVKCNYCEKSYVGRGGLNRHYKLNPTHGKADNDIGNEFGDSVYSSDSFQSSVLASTSGMMAHPKKVRINNDVTLAMEVYPNHESRRREADLLYRGDRKIKRGRPTVVDDKRKRRLQEVSKHCSDQDIMDLFIQRCPFTVSLWDILLLKNSKVYDSSVDSLLGELTNLHEQVSSHLNERLIPLPEEAYQNDESGCNLSNKNIFEMVDEKLSACLNLPKGKYTVKPEPASENDVHNSHVGSDIKNNKQLMLNSVASRKQQELEQNKTALPPRKRLKLSDVEFLLRGLEDKKALVLNNGNQNVPVTPQMSQNFSSISSLLAGKSYSFNNFATQATFGDKKPIVFDGTDDALVSSTSQVNSFSPLADNNSYSNLASSSGFASSLPDSSFQCTTNSSLNEIWPDIAKTSAEYHASDNSGLISMNSSALLSIKEDKSELCEQNVNQNSGGTDPVGTQFKADSYSTNPDEATSQEQGICVTCFPMQEYIQVPENARYVQTEDGLVIVKNPDSSFQIYGDLKEDITVEMLEAHFPPIN